MSKLEITQSMLKSPSPVQILLGGFYSDITPLYYANALRLLRLLINIKAGDVITINADDNDIRVYDIRYNALLRVIIYSDKVYFYAIRFGGSSTTLFFDYYISHKELKAKTDSIFYRDYKVALHKVCERFEILNYKKNKE